ncbi:OPT superfamily oligopeptide transporter [Violaceomyces palustris]|uniref:OPT superfamily oligopeptide transporter n=1 Tax=Violaceomyces palustris TaxID=1673888 RepID=A0ACD0P6R5_9BASI|nr:OPT superfamily oligopeptide transporter [Violaceomyces palustris]
MDRQANQDRQSSMAGEGERAEDFTFRAIAAGLLIGCLLAFTNLYLGLQTGWISLMSLQSALLGFAIFKVLPRSLSLAGRRFYFMTTPFTPEENVLVQTTAGAVGIMPLSAGLVGVIPALTMLNMDKDGSPPIVLGWLELLGWCFALAYFGVFFASPLREPMIIREKLAFPSGTATAQLISVLHKVPLFQGRVSTGSNGGELNRGGERSAEGHRDQETSPLLQEDDSDENVMKGSSGWKALLWSFLSSATFTILSYYIPVLYAMPIFDFLSPSHDLAATWGWWFTPSLNYVGQGIIMGLPTTISMTAGAFVGWAILSPIAHYYGWAPGHPMDSESGSKGWILWVSLAIMCSESIVGLIALVASNGLSDLKRWLSRRSDPTTAQYGPISTESPSDLDASVEDMNGLTLERARLIKETVEVEHEPPHRLTPLSWVTWGLVSSTILAIALIWAAFGTNGIHPWATLVGIVLASVFAILGVRALGETDLNPVSGIGKISQLIFAILQPGNVVANLIAGGISEAGAMQAGDLMQDYKTGHLIGASPRSQFKGQLIGSTLGILISCFAYKLYTETYEIPGPQFPAPTAAVWLNLARLVNRGHLPSKADVFMLAFGLLFALTGTLRTLARSKALKVGGHGGRNRPLSAAEKIVTLLPSGIAFAVGMLNTPNFSLARLVGGVIAHTYSKRRAAVARDRGGAPLGGIFIIVVASGFVLGEGAASIAGLLLKQSGAEPLTCWGCRGGCAGGCP